MLRSGAVTLVVVVVLVFALTMVSQDGLTFMKEPLPKPLLNMMTDQEGDEACSIPAPAEGSLLGLVDLLQQWKRSAQAACREKERLFHVIFHLEPRYSRLELRGHMRQKMLTWLGARGDLMSLAYNQSVVYVMNKWTYSASIFNSLRAMRPKKTNPLNGQTDRQYVDKLSRELENNCDFCKYQKNTASDVFGRIYGNYSYTAANTFKLEEWHSLVIFKSHHPIDWKYNELYDSFLTTKKWFAKVYSISPQSVYPMIFWDLMGHAGGSQPHPHYHPFVSRDGYYGYFKQWQNVAQEYEVKHGQNYFTHLVQTHMDVGLAVRHGTAVAISPVNPKKDYEFVVIAPELNKDFVDLLYFIIKAYFEDLEKYCFSAGITLPPLDNKVSDLPTIARIVTRGSVTSLHADVTSMELFAGSLVETDPYKAIQLLKTSIQKRKSHVLL